MPAFIGPIIMAGILARRRDDERREEFRKWEEEQRKKDREAASILPIRSYTRRRRFSSRSVTKATKDDQNPPSVPARE